jgi:hypothetical protein
VLLGDGVLLGDAVLMGDLAAQSSKALVGGDNTTSMTLVLDTGSTSTTTKKK